MTATAWALVGLAVVAAGAVVTLSIALSRKATEAAAQRLRADEATDRAQADEVTIAQLRARGADDTARLESVVASKQADADRAREELDDAARTDRNLAHLRLVGVLHGEDSSDTTSTLPAQPPTDDPSRRRGGAS